MSELHVKIDWTKKSAVFWGDTFRVKEDIKSLGSARWNNAAKQWEVRGLDVTRADLEAQFPNIQIEEAGEAKPVPADGDASASKKLDAEGGDSLSAARVLEQKGLSVVQFSTELRKVVQNAFPGTIFIYGVLSSVKSGRDGRYFLEITDKDRPEEAVSCVIWRDAERICKPLLDAGFKLEKDLQVMFEVKVDLNRRWSQISLSVLNIISEYTLAKVAALRDLTNERLRKEGLFDKNSKLSLAFLPQRLGILTSAGGTVINDFRASLDESKFGFKLFWLNVSVQGSAAKSDLIQGIKTLSARNDLDAVLVFRGGGGASDLAVFNEYEVAREICLCAHPVFAAIGHQEDQSSAQDVSYRAFGVPKDIGHFFAEIIFSRRRELKEAVRRSLERVLSLSNNLQQRLSDFSGSLYSVGVHFLRARVDTISRISAQLPALGFASVGRFSERAESLGKNLNAELNHAIDRRERRLESMEQLIENVSPEMQLKRGFSIVRRANSDEIVVSGGQLSSGDKVELQFWDKLKQASID